MDKRFALISVYNKSGLDKLAKTLQKLGLVIIATGGTAKFLQDHDISYTPIEKITGNPESFNGRMKTLSFEIMSGILFDRDNNKQVKEVSILKIPKIDVVVCNFYPFWEKQTLEMMDIGGPTMVRAAAKNFPHVTVAVDPSDYGIFDSEITADKRQELAAKALSYVANYDVQISNYFSQKTGLFDRHFIAMDGGVILRYGENPHQKGYFYQNPLENDKLSLGSFKILQGKSPSFNNLLDVSAGIETVSLINQKKPVCVIIKHTNPCGAALGFDLKDAFEKAWFKGDPLAAFGGVIIFNKTVTGELAKQMLSGKKFFEVVAAPHFEKEALLVFAQKPKRQLWENEALGTPYLLPYEDVKKIRGGFLVQDGDTYQITEKDFKVVTRKKPTKQEVADLLFAFKIAQVSKSNAVAVAKNGVLLSSGVGQQDRKRCCQLCVSKAVSSLKGASAATDGFFPFRDGPDVLMKAGISAIAQPGGSIRDREVIDACDEKEVAMVFTGVRNFRH
ncbi:bifunctional phosphoribosylaminoimidazolecarboxamide formyltransferase/IMP cyclohydrolase [Candidatus Microgenomates bacterium]|nr:bifunctional phosphoribosylaminoimidazolecarboxamide formyltransferase/IMP cyclohydrolase [Candidatus Microgenomates bacterium]